MPPARRILIVDDDPYTRELVGTALRGQGHEVVAAPRYGQGLEAARAQRPHLILLDVVLPDGSGVELAQVLRAELPAAEMPRIVLMSAFSRGRLADQRRMKEEARAIAFLTKPLALPALIELVEEALRDVAGSPADGGRVSASPATAPAVPGPGPDGGRGVSPPFPAASPAAPPPVAAAAAPPVAAPAGRSAGPATGVLAALAQAWRRGWTGTLALSRPSAEKTIVIEGGQVVWATTSLAEERLGRVLLGMGLLPRAEYESSLKEAAERGLRLGEVLVARGALAPSHLAEGLGRQVEGIVLGAIGWPEGSYRVTPTTTRPATGDRIAVAAIPRLVRRAFAEVVSADRLDARLAALGNQPIVRRPEVPQAALALLSPTPEEAAVLDALAAPSPLASVLAAHPGGREAAAPLVGALLALGIIGPVGARAGEEPPAARAPDPPARTRAAPRADHQAAHDSARRLLRGEAAFEAGRGAVDRGDLTAAADAFAEATRLCPEEGEYRAWSAWVRARVARADFDRTLAEVKAELEEAARLTPSSAAVYDLLKQVIQLGGMPSAPADRPDTPPTGP